MKQLPMYEKEHERKGFAVYRRAIGRSATFIIARIPDTKKVGASPASTLREFATREEAVSALNRWAEAPTVAKLINPPKGSPPRPKKVIQKPKPKKVIAKQYDLEGVTK